MREGWPLLIDGKIAGYWFRPRDDTPTEYVRWQDDPLAPARLRPVVESFSHALGWHYRVIA